MRRPLRLAAQAVVPVSVHSRRADSVPTPTPAMVGEVRKVIGGLEVRVTAVGCRIAIPDDPAYRPFIDFEGLRTGPRGDISIHVFADSTPSVEGLPEVFDNDETWKMYRADGGYVLSFSGNGLPPREHILVRADSGTRTVSVHCLDVMPGAPEEPPLVFDPVRYPLDQILLMNHMACRGGIIVHSAGFSLDSAGLVFAGMSGAGKSTMARIIAANAPEAKPLSDDRIVLRMMEGRWRAYGTPWPGEAGAAARGWAELRALFFLARDSAHRVEPLSPAQALKRLFPVVSCPWYDRRDRKSVV